jgi:hypothetical protein
VQAIAVNQKWFGRPGMKLNTSLSSQFDVWAKPQSATCTAVLVINIAPEQSNETALPFADLHLSRAVSAPYTVRSLWEHRAIAVPAKASGLPIKELAPHGSGFFVVCGSRR